MIEFSQTISDQEYKKAIAIHYFGYKYTYINPILGVIILSVTVFKGINNAGPITHTTVFICLLSIFLLIRPLLYIQNVFKSIKSNKLSSNKVNIKITDDDKIQTEVDDNTSSISMKDLYSYFDSKNFLYLYMARNQYFILDKNNISSNQISDIVNTLNRLNIKERK
jgi:YcxB-like protein